MPITIVSGQVLVLGALHQTKSSLRIRRQHGFYSPHLTKPSHDSSIPKPRVCLRLNDLGSSNVRHTSGQWRSPSDHIPDAGMELVASVEGNAPLSVQAVCFCCLLCYTCHRCKTLFYIAQFRSKLSSIFNYPR